MNNLLRTYGLVHPRSYPAIDVRDELPGAGGNISELSRFVRPGAMYIMQHTAKCQVEQVPCAFWKLVARWIRHT